MGIAMTAECVLCYLNRNVETARKYGTEEQATAFIMELMKLYTAAPEGVSTPWFSDKVNRLFVEMYGLDPDRFRTEKEASNRFALERLDQIRARAEQAEDPVYAGLQLAILGNYIDFGALYGEVSFDKLEQMMAQAAQMELDHKCYVNLLSDLEKGSKLLYLTDNAGEIVFDRVFAEQIQKRFPHLEITFCVRGGPAQNDATREDAAAAGIPFKVIDNGTCIAGTVLDCISEEARQAIEEADVIIAKGQGNCETLYGAPLNIYYAFLVKCSRFINRFGKPKLTPMLTK